MYTKYKLVVLCLFLFVSVVQAQVLDIHTTSTEQNINSETVRFSKEKITLNSSLLSGEELRITKEVTTIIINGNCKLRFRQIVFDNPNQQIEIKSENNKSGTLIILYFKWRNKSKITFVINEGSMVNTLQLKKEKFYVDE